MGRRPIYNKGAMTSTERWRRWYEKQGPRYAALCRAWAACDRKEQTRYLRGLRAASAIGAKSGRITGPLLKQV
jgi:hypothetical protein